MSGKPKKVREVSTLGIQEAKQDWLKKTFPQTVREENGFETRPQGYYRSRQSYIQGRRENGEHKKARISERNELELRQAKTPDGQGGRKPTQFGKHGIEKKRGHEKSQA